jgi:hypothetical protein
MIGHPSAASPGKLDLRLLAAGAAALSISTLFSSMKPVLISSLVEQAGMSMSIAGLAAAMPFVGGVAASFLMSRLGSAQPQHLLRRLSVALPVLELGNALWFSSGLALLASQFAIGLCAGIILGLVSHMIARSARASETFGLADGIGVLLMSVMLTAVGSAVDRMGLRGGFLVAAVFCTIFALALHAGLRGSMEADGSAPSLASLPATTNSSPWRAVAVIAMGVAFVTCSGFGFAFMVTVARQLGMSYQAASSGIGVVLLMSAGGCFLGGWVVARVMPGWPLLGAFLLCGAGWHVALHAQDQITFFLGLVPAVVALQFCFPILLSLAASLDSDGRMAAVGAPLIVSGFAWAAMLAGLIVQFGGIGGLSIATDAGMVLCAGLLVIGTEVSTPDGRCCLPPSQSSTPAKQ